MSQAAQLKRLLRYNDCKICLDVCIHCWDDKTATCDCLQNHKTTHLIHIMCSVRTAHNYVRTYTCNQVHVYLYAWWEVLLLVWLHAHHYELSVLNAVARLTVMDMPCWIEPAFVILCYHLFIDHIRYRSWYIDCKVSCLLLNNATVHQNIWKLCLP